MMVAGCPGGSLKQLGPLLPRNGIRNGNERVKEKKKLLCGRQQRGGGENKKLHLYAIFLYSKK